MNIIIQFQFQFTERIDDLAGGRLALIGDLQQVSAVFVALIDFVEIADSAKSKRAPHFFPIYLIRDRGRFAEAALLNQSVDLVQTHSKFIFVQYSKPLVRPLPVYAVSEQVRRFSRTSLCGMNTYVILPKNS
jgi:hypothetical protein